ncbi:hypothetical protein [Erythrobacter sp.]|uniref:hypothetical protein n=1 Tax=Erythrobacter sp. TaxID=1042 RepID=UPI00311FD966
MSEAKLRNEGLAIEWVLACLVLLSLAHATWFLFTFKYLPPPFFYEPSDVHADWFNTAFWSHNPNGAFDTWTTLYPPLSFVILRFLSVGKCYPRTREFEPSPGLAARDCDWIGHVGIWGFWILGVALLFVALRKIDRSRAIPRTICVGLGWPILNGIERGNLILIAFPFFLLAVMPIFKSARLRWIAAGFAINLKVYLIAPFMAQLIMRRWRWVEGTLLATIVIYLLSYAMLGAGTLSEIFVNLSSWTENRIENPLDFWPATTYQGLTSLMKNNAQIFPTLLILGSREVSTIPIVIEILLRLTQGSLFVAMAASWLRPEAITRYRIYILGLLFALITTEGGGYTPIFWMAMVMCEPWRGIGPKIAIVSSYLLACSYDIPITNLATLVRYTYYFDTEVIVEMDLTVWPLLRPLLIQLIAIALSFSTIHSVWGDIRRQGWAERWRFRADAALLPWIRSPKNPAK